MTPFCSDALVSPPNLYPPWFHHTLPHCSAVPHCSTVLFHSFTVLFHCSLLHTSTLLPYRSTLFHNTVPQCSTLFQCSTTLFHTVPLFHHTVPLFYHTVPHCSTTPCHSVALFHHSSTLLFHTVPPYCSTILFHTVPMFHHIVPHCSTVPPHCSTLFHTIIPYYFLPWCFAASASCDRELCYELITLVVRDYSMRTNLLERPNGCFQMSVLSCLLN